MLRVVAIALLVGAPAVAAAQPSGDGISFRAGLGVTYAPGYFGSDEQVLGFGGAFSRERFQLGRFATGDGPRDGMIYAGSVRFVGAREASEFAELAGLPDVDPTVELGGSLGYRLGDAEAFVSLRYGFLGHNSYVGEVGADYTFDPSPDISVTAGPRALWGDDGYARTYFGVDEAAAMASAFDAYDASAGLMSAGVEVEAIYAINENWEIVGTFRYDRLQGDAADSPITVSDDQLSTTIALTRRFSFDF